MKRRTSKQQLDDINKRLSENNQKIKVKVIDKNHIEFTNGVVLYKPQRGKYLLKLLKSTNDYYAQNSDRLLSSLDYDAEFEHISNEGSKIAQRKGGKQCQKIHKEKIKKNLNTSGLGPWNKGLSGTGICKAWNKGLTKETNDSLRKVSESRKGSGNPMYGKKHSDEYKKNNLRL